MVLQGNRVYLVRVDPIRLTAKLKIAPTIYNCRIAVKTLCVIFPGNL